MGSRQTLSWDPLRLGAPESEGTVLLAPTTTPLGTYSRPSKPSPPYLSSVAVRGIPLTERSFSTWLGNGCGMGWAAQFLGPFPALSPLRDSTPSLLVGPLMRSCPSHPGVGDLDPAAEGVCGEAGEGGKRQRNSAAPTKLEDGGRMPCFENNFQRQQG